MAARGKDSSLPRCLSGKRAIDLKTAEFGNPRRHGDHPVDYPVSKADNYSSLLTTRTSGFYMYAIFSDGGRQFKVSEGQVIDIDFREVAEGSEITFDRVLAVSTGDQFRLGQPVVAGASVVARVQGEVKGEKLTIQKMRRRKNMRRRTGHRQTYLRVEIIKIAG